MNKKQICLSFALFNLLIHADAQKLAEKTKIEKSPIEKLSYSGLKFRSIGPALTSGRISDLAINPNNFSEYYIAAASGGVWKTENAGTTFQPIFDNYGSFSIGCLALDPSNSQVIWVGTGENNNQRSVAYGDGIYKSEDGGKSFTNMGLKTSEHIGKIIIDPRNSNIVYVAAYGPLWKEGGERGIYKTIDAGKTWERILHVSDNTGFNEIHFDPKNPDVLYATAHQRRRHVFTYISGGPESAIYKSTDAGKTWNKIMKGLPNGDIGRIALAIPAKNTDIVYAIVEASEKNGGFFRSINRGASFEKMSDFSTAGNYYQEIYCDPNNENIIYAMDTYAQVSLDGGKTFKSLGEENKHVDNHAMWVNPLNSMHILMGCDGGLYESFDGAKTWDFKPNLNITQFYRVSVDNASPFYNVYGGTQDNYSLGGPSRTTSKSGIVNSDWFVTLGGDGFKTQIDPENPNIVYSQYQYGNLYRFDKKSGEQLFIQPQEGKNDQPNRWNWDSPLIISPHKNTRLYFAANKLFKSDDRGNSWEAISGDLTRQIDRDKLPVMGKVWSMDAVAKGSSTSFYGNIVALSESPKKQGLIYIGTDDGLIQITNDDGKNWKKVDKFPGVPETTYVNAVYASQHIENRVYAVFNNHKNGDFKPYILKSEDKGNSWTSISGNLPERGSVYSFIEDHVNPNLIFAGTEFGLFFSIDAGNKWIQLNNNLPVIAIKDLDIQKRENDLVLATFGRGFYILDDYSPLRTLSNEVLNKEAEIFPVKDGLMFIESEPLGGRGKSFQGESFFTADNLPPSVAFTYYLKDVPLTKKEQRQKAEKELEEKKQNIVVPSFEDMRLEEKDTKAYLIFTITDENNEVIKKIKTSASKGLNRLFWDLRFPTTNPINLSTKRLDDPFTDADKGQLVLPGNYFVSLAMIDDAEVKELVAKIPFKINSLNNTTLPAEDRKALVVYQKEIAETRRKMKSANALRNNLSDQIKYIYNAIEQTPAIPLTELKNVKLIEAKLDQIALELLGDRSISKRDYPTLPGLMSRIENVVYSSFFSTSATTEIQKQQHEIVKQSLQAIENDLMKIKTQVASLEQMLEKYKAPYTPGR